MGGSDKAVVMLVVLNTLLALGVYFLPEQRNVFAVFLLLGSLSVFFIAFSGVAARLFVVAFLVAVLFSWVFVNVPEVQSVALTPVLFLLGGGYLLASPRIFSAFSEAFS